jgi:hypothetical protein
VSTPQTHEDKREDVAIRIATEGRFLDLIDEIEYEDLDEPDADSPDRGAWVTVRVWIPSEKLEAEIEARDAIERRDAEERASQASEGETT